MIAFHYSLLPTPYSLLPFQMISQRTITDPTRTARRVRNGMTFSISCLISNRNCGDATQRCIARQQVRAQLSPHGDMRRQASHTHPARMPLGSPFRLATDTISLRRSPLCLP